MWFSLVTLFTNVFMSCRLPARPIKHVSFSEHHQPPSSKWRPKNITMKLKSGYNSSPRPAAMSHNQFVNHPKSPQKYTMPPRYAKINQKPNKIQESKNNGSAIVETQSDIKTSNCSCIKNVFFLFIYNLF